MVYFCEDPDCEGHDEEDLIPSSEFQDSPTSIRRQMMAMVINEGKTGEAAVKLAALYSSFVIDAEVPEAPVLELAPRGRIVPKLPEA